MPFWKRNPDEQRPSRTLWLIKDDPDGKWYCQCPQGIVNAPHHDEHTYPTGGTGWLFTCVRCRKAFMFAKAALIQPSLMDLAARDTPRTRKVMDKHGNVREHVLLATAAEWLARVEPMAAELREGRRYVFFDGRLLEAIHGPVKFKGLWRSHDLADLPHLSDPPLGDLLTDPDYWLAERESSG